MLDLSDNQYYEEETPINDYYGPPTRQLQKAPHDPNGYYPPLPDPADYSAGTCVAEGNELSYMGIDFLVRKLDLLTVGKPEREDKITGNE